MKDGSVKDTQTDAGELVSQGRDLTRRTLLKDGDVIASGDIIEVVMTVKTKNDVEYLMLLDPKPAGCESRETASGYARLGTVSGYREIGDEEIRLFLSSLPMGQYQISHRLRAERPGRFRPSLRPCTPRNSAATAGNTKSAFPCHKTFWKYPSFHDGPWRICRRAPLEAGRSGEERPVCLPPHLPFPSPARFSNVMDSGSYR